MNKPVIKQITIADFCKLKPNRGQFLNGKTTLSKSRVKKLSQKINEVLFENIHFVQVRNGTTLISGHHRQAAAKEAMEAGLLDPKAKITILDYRNLKADFCDKAAFLSNYANNVTNKKGHMLANTSPMAVKVFQPIYHAFNTGVLKKALSEGIRTNLSILIGALFNENPELATALLSGKAAITGEQIYCARRLAPSNEEFLNTVPSIDLRKKEDSIYKLFRTAGILLNHLDESPKWDLIRTKKTPMSIVYILLGAATQALIKEKNVKEKGFITYSRVDRALRRDAKKLKMALTNHSSDPMGTENFIISSFTGV